MENEKRLIDANAFLKALNERPLDFLDVGGDFGYFDETIDSVVDGQPTVDAVEVKHGSWIEDGYYGNPFVCSHCGSEGCYSGNYNNKQYYYTNYCPNCGAKMDGGNEDV